MSWARAWAAALKDLEIRGSRHARHRAVRTCRRRRPDSDARLVGEALEIPGRARRAADGQTVRTAEEPKDA